MLTRLLVLVISAALMGACAGAPSRAPRSATAPSAVAVALRTRAPSSPIACPMARNEGILVRNTQSGAGFQDNDGVVWQVIWPADYTARDEGGRLVVLDGAGSVIAHEGDHIEISGQDVGGGTWLGCGGMRVLTS